MKYGLIGEKLGHSFSRDVHGMLADYEYELKEIPKNELDSFMIKREFKAINVTIPYKEAVIPHLYYISDEARAIGSVNTIVNRDGKLYGYNTDFSGMCAQINKMHLNLSGIGYLCTASVQNSGMSNMLVFGKTRMNPETWYNISFVRKGIDQTVSVYIDGEYQGSYTGLTFDTDLCFNFFRNLAY